MPASPTSTKAGASPLGLGVSGSKRSELLPEVPTFAEAGQARYDMSYWWGIAAPAGTPRPIVDRLHKEVVKACSQPRLREAFLKSAALAVTSTPAEMTKFVANEVEVWRRIVKVANVTIQ